MAASASFNVFSETRAHTAARTWVTTGRYFRIQQPAISTWASWQQQHQVCPAPATAQHRIDCPATVNRGSAPGTRGPTHRPVQLRLNNIPVLTARARKHRHLTLGHRKPDQPARVSAAPAELGHRRLGPVEPRHRQYGRRQRGHLQRNWLRVGGTSTGIANVGIANTGSYNPAASTTATSMASTTPATQHRLLQHHRRREHQRLHRGQ